MLPTRFEQVMRRYGEAKSLAGGDLARFLATLRAEDPELAREVDALLAHAERFRAPAESTAPSGSPRIEGFRIQSFLARGAMGVVYVAEQEEFGRQVALKVLRLELATPEAKLRFERESRLLGRLRHAGIASVHASGVESTPTGPRPWIALELVRGGQSLTQWARDTSPHVHRVLGIMAEVCDAVQHAHENGVIHRDLKPHNVLVDASGRARVLDFGLAHGSDDEQRRTLTGAVLGTLDYMSPEQASGDPRALGASSDVYALGAMLYELLSGELPHGKAPSLQAALARIREQDAPLVGRRRPELRGDVETMVAMALARDPKRRYPSAAAFAEDLRRHLAHLPIVARRAGMTDRFQKLARRHRSVFKAVAVVFVALFLALAYSLSGWWRAGQAELERVRERDLLVRLSDENVLELLRARMQALWPADSARVPGIEAWLLDARALAQRLPLYRSSLAELRAQAEQERDARLQWALELKERLVAGIAALAEPRVGAIAQMERRLEVARALRPATLEAWSERWQAALEEIADTQISPQYAGLRLPPQEGLIPLGRDPASGLQEFALWEPHARVPARLGHGGELWPQTDDMLVLVLMPGGRTRIGSQGRDPLAPLYDPDTREHEGPPREVELEPYFLAKFELSSNQWTRWSGWDESKQGSRPQARIQGGLQPAMQMSWHEASEVLRQRGLLLPTEAQWEHAARAGSERVFVVGDHPALLAGRANFNWGLTLTTLADPCLLETPELRPIGALAPNPWGLHDMLGNVGEWCRDYYKVDAFRRELRAGDGFVLAAPTDDRTVRGGSFSLPASMLRVAARSDQLATGNSGSTGVRAARAVAWK